MEKFLEEQLHRIAHYEKRFTEVSHWYDIRLKDLIIDHFDISEAYQTAKKLFDQDEINFVTIDGTYSIQLVDIVVFFLLSLALSYAFS